MSTVLVLYYSRYGAVKQMAQHLARGVESVPGVEARIRTVPRFLEHGSNGTVGSESGAPYVTLDDLKVCGISSSPTRWQHGSADEAFHRFDKWVVVIWRMVNKPATVFTSTASMHGGQEQR